MASFVTLLSIFVPLEVWTHVLSPWHASCREKSVNTRTSIASNSSYWSDPFFLKKSAQKCHWDKTFVNSEPKHAHFSPSVGESRMLIVYIRWCHLSSSKAKNCRFYCLFLLLFSLYFCTCIFESRARCCIKHSLILKPNMLISHPQLVRIECWLFTSRWQKTSTSGMLSLCTCNHFWSSK